MTDVIQTQAQTRYGITPDHEYSATHKRQRIVVWSGPQYSAFEAEGLSLPSGGFMLTTHAGDKVRVDCPSPRTEATSEEVDAAIDMALTVHDRDMAGKTLDELLERDNDRRSVVTFDAETATSQVVLIAEVVEPEKPEWTPRPVVYIVVAALLLGIGWLLGATTRLDWTIGPWWP